MTKIVMIGYHYSLALHKAVQHVNKILDNAVQFTFLNAYDIDNGTIPEDKVIRALKQADIILIDVRGGDKVSKIITDNLSNTKKTIVTLVGGSPEIIELTRLGSFSLGKFMQMRKKLVFKRSKKSNRVDYGKLIRMRELFEKIGKRLPIGIFKHARNYALILKYYENPSERNLTSMLLLLLKEYGKVNVPITIPEPETLPPMGILDFHTGNIYEDVKQYLEEYNFSDRLLIGILFYGGFHFEQSVVAAKLLAKLIEEQELGVIPVFCSDLRYYLVIEKFFLEDGKPLIDCLIDLLWFRFAGGPIGGDHSQTFRVLKKLNVPILHGVHLSSITLDKWLESKHGIPPVETVTTVILPELDGRIEPFLALARVKSRKDNTIVDEYVGIEDRLRKLAKRACNWVKLRRKANREKRLAIILYNYPPGEENLGKAAYLDAFGSLVRILKALKERGYHVGEIPNERELRRIFLERGIVNPMSRPFKLHEIRNLIRIDLEKYLSWFEELPDKIKRDIIETWGEPPGFHMVVDSEIIIPGVILGNIFISIQPSRGIHEDPSKIYHSKELPPHHQYIAFYKWIKKEFKADAIIHLGTHGTLEFLPGKEIGLSRYCYPDILIDDIPNIYIYHVTNASEAAIAKRRSYALIINHMSPPFILSDTYGEIAEIERLLREYYESSQYDGNRSKEIKNKILELAKKYKFGESIEEVHDKIFEYKRSLIPKGLHVFGTSLSREELVNYLTFVARYDRGKIKSLHRMLSEAMNIDYDILLEEPSKISKDGKRGSEIFKEIENTVREIIESCLIDGENLQTLLAKKKLKVDVNEIEKTLSFLQEIKMNIENSDELTSLLRALEGEYIMPGPGGDPIRNPMIYPTGRNTFQLDPTNIPTSIAMERGTKIAEEYIKQYVEKYGKYPRVVSVVLWGFETMKTGGETLAVIFRLLGVRPKWKSIYIRELEVIPLSELGRPRIDVVVTICGIFRDTFYNLVELLDRAFKIVADLDEPLEMNYIKANYLEESKKNQGRVYRIFGPPEGEYATTLTKLIETGSWGTEMDIVNAYLDSMKYAYGENYRSVDVREHFEEIMKKIDIVTQVRDTVEYEITDLDHYYEFLGGLAKTVEKKKGQKPLILVADTTKERVRVEGINEAIKRGVVTRLINPKWLNEMLKHGHNGAQKIADRVEYLLGLAATTGSVDNWIWDQVAQTLVFNEEISSKIREENPWALQKISRVLIEANARGYWKASDEIIKELKNVYESVQI